MRQEAGQRIQRPPCPAPLRKDSRSSRAGPRNWNPELPGPAAVCAAARRAIGGKVPRFGTSGSETSKACPAFCGVWNFWTEKFQGLEILAQKTSKVWKFWTQNFQGLEILLRKVPRFGAFRPKSSKVWSFSTKKFQGLEIVHRKFLRAPPHQSGRVWKLWRKGCRERCEVSWSASVLNTHRRGFGSRVKRFRDLSRVKRDREVWGK